MPALIDGQVYYRTAEAYRVIGVSRNTLYRWLHKGVLNGSERRDSRGWRLFTQKEIDRLNRTINSVTVVGA